MVFFFKIPPANIDKSYYLSVSLVQDPTITKSNIVIVYMEVMVKGKKL